MIKFRVRDPGWWYWLATTIALYVGPFVDARGYTAALLITVVHLSHYLIRDRGLTFPVQVRSAVLFFMLLGLVEPAFSVWMSGTGGVGLVVQPELQGLGAEYR